MLNRVIISLGSNRNSEANIALADDLLCNYFISVYFSDIVYTEPIGEIQSGLFLNQVAIAYTPECPGEINKAFKQMESRLGRTPESKGRGDIPIDIDLLRWNDRILKPDDLQREYVKSLLRTISATG